MALPGAQALARPAAPGAERARLCIAFTRRLYEGTHAERKFHASRRMVNVLHPDAAAAFVAVTHERYAAELGPLLRHVDATFTDEPSWLSAFLPALGTQRVDNPLTPPSVQYPALPWAPDLSDAFAAAYDDDIAACLPLVFADFPDAVEPAAAPFRHRGGRRGLLLVNTADAPVRVAVGSPVAGDWLRTDLATGKIRAPCPPGAKPQKDKGAYAVGVPAHGGVWRSQRAGVPGAWRRRWCPGALLSYTYKPCPPRGIRVERDLKGPDERDNMFCRAAGRAVAAGAVWDRSGSGRRSARDRRSLRCHPSAGR